MECTILESLSLRTEELALDGAGVESSAFVGSAGPLRALTSVDTGHRVLRLRVEVRPLRRLWNRISYLV